MTYLESAALMTDSDFNGRVKVAVLKYGLAIIDEPSTVAGHTSRFRWAQNALTNPSGVTTQTVPPTVMDSAVQAAGPTISDDGLQGAVETTVNKML